MVLKRNIILITIAAIVIIILGTGIIIFLATTTNRSGSRIQKESGATSGAHPVVGTTTPRATTSTMSSTTSEAPFPEVCETEECAKLGARMRLLMNISTNPCDDFYEYVCGSFAAHENEKNGEIEVQRRDDYVSMYNTWESYQPVTKSEKIAKIFVEKCEKTREDPELNEDIWKNEDLTELLNEVAKVEPVHTGFMTNEIFFQDVGDETGLLLVLRNGIEPNSPLEIVSNNNISTSSSKWFAEIPIEVKDVPIDMHLIDLKKYYTNLLPEEHRNEFPNWVVFVQLADFNLMKDVIQKLGVEKIKAELYKKWKSRLDGFLATGDYILSACFSSAFKLFPGTFSMIFIKNLVKSENVQKSNQMFKDLKVAFNEMLDENTWIDENLKKILRKELNSMKSSLAVPDEHKDVSNIDRMYDRIEKEQKVEDQSYLTLVRNILKMNSEETFLRVARVDPVTFAANPSEFDANYGVTSNRVSAAPFLFNYPYIDVNLPEWNNLATFGFIVGHEIGHAFDAVNFRLSPTLQEISMSEEMKNEFSQRIDCISKKYDKYQFSDGTFSSGERTKQEDSADMIGFNLAYRLFKKLAKKQQKLPGFENQTVEQNYFQRLANVWCEKELEGEYIEAMKEDKHSARKFRINGMMSNSVDFARTFGCKMGSPMNTEKKCPLFK